MTENQGEWLYNDIVKDHFFNPRNYLTAEQYEADGFGTAGSPVCGDLMKVWIKVDPKTNKIVDCKWQTFGCASAIASTSMMSVMVLENEGMDLEEAKKITAQKIMERLGGLPENKVHCSVLGHLALRNAIENYLNKNKEGDFSLKSKKEETPGVFTLNFVFSGNKIFDYKAGQFVMMKILKDGASGALSRAYTITSLPGEGVLSFTVKRAGVFSNLLCDLETGDKVEVSAPHGNFYPAADSGNESVFLAGGIGITPFFAIIKDLYGKKTKKRITLFYSNKRKEDIVFYKELNEISKKWKNLNMIYILTRDENKDPQIKECKRIDAEMLKKYLKDLSSKEYFICGPSMFVTGIKEQLEKTGVDRNSIKTEAFY